MQPPVLIYATMADGVTIVERADDFAAFTALALGFQRDSECVRLTWQPERCIPGSPEYLAADAAWRERTARRAVGDGATGALVGEVRS